jgi:hypothetical protein
MTYYNIGDRVRLRDGMLSWITKREGWTVEDSYNGYGLICEGGGVTVSVPWSEIEPEFPSIPPEPPRVVGQAWRDADGGLVQTDNAEGSPLAYTLTGTESVVCWQDLDHPLTALYPVPDPDGYVDREDVEPDSPPIPAEPERVSGQAWRDAEGQTVVCAEPDAIPYITTTGDGAYLWHYWQDLAHPLTPLYPVPDPDDDEAVESLRQRTNLAYHNGTKYWPDVPTVRAVLRALREQS